MSKKQGPREYSNDPRGIEGHQNHLSSDPYSVLHPEESSVDHLHQQITAPDGQYNSCETNIF